MESREVVGRFLSAGYSLDSASLEFFISNPEKVDAFLEAAKGAEKTGRRPAIITLGYVQNILKAKPSAGGCARLAVIKDFSSRKERRTSVEDAVAERTKEYEAARSLLAEKLEDVVSINKMQKQAKFSLIVSVLEKVGSDSATVEDATGSAVLRFEDVKEFDSMLEGDTFGAVCESADGTAVAKRIVWPDIPLKRKPEGSSNRGLCVFVAGADQQAAGFEAKSFEKLAKWLDDNAEKNPQVVAFAREEHVKDVEELLAKLPEDVCKSVVTTRSIVELGGLKILSCESGDLQSRKPAWGSDGEIMVNILKRRSLPACGARGRSCSAGHATFFDVVPDIFVATGSKEPSASNYKGTNVIAIGDFTGTPVFFAVDLQTRDVNKLDLS